MINTSNVILGESTESISVDYTGSKSENGFYWGEYKFNTDAITTSEEAKKVGLALNMEADPSREYQKVK